MRAWRASVEVMSRMRASLGSSRSGGVRKWFASTIADGSRTTPSGRARRRKRGASEQRRALERERDVVEPMEVDETVVGRREIGRLIGVGAGLSEDLRPPRARELRVEVSIADPRDRGERPPEHGRRY